MGNILLRNITVENEQKDIYIREGIITQVLPAGSIWPHADCEMMDCTGKVAVPSFVNMHTHVGMTLMRGIGEDMVFQDWLDHIWKIEENVDYDFVYWNAKVACIEMIKTGTTTFNDQYWFYPAARQAALEMGIRPVLGYDVMDKGDDAEAERQIAQCERMFELEKDLIGGRSVYALAFHAIYSVSEKMMVWCSDFARKNGVFLHIHLSETLKEVEDCKAAHGGLSPVEYLDSIGVLGPHILAAHTLWLSEHDIEILAANRVNCIHNINSNTKLSSGYRFLYNELRDAGVNICLGTDGCASSNNLDMLEAMKTAALFQKAWRSDPKALPLNELMDMATINGAKALNLNTGRIAEGCLADISIVNTDSYSFLSPGSFLANFVYSAHSDCIDSVISGGRFVMRHRIVEGELDILHEARKVLSKITR